VFFGIGIALLGIIQRMKTGHAAGLESFIYGKTASMLASDAQLIAVAALLVLVVCGLLFKELGVVCFDPGYARTQGWPVGLLDVLLMGLVVFVTVIGLQAVGLILVIALLIIPPAAARFWTHNLLKMVIASAIIGAVGCLVGAALSALLPKLPAGAVIVTTIGAVFLFSMIFAPERGILARWLEHYRLSRRIALQHLLRAIYEWTEHHGDLAAPADHLEEVRSWSATELRRTVRAATRAGLVANGQGPGGLRLTEAGMEQASRLVRNHRLWELYLITHADIAPSHVDRDADQIEHVLGAEMVKELEELLAGQSLPANPHPAREPQP
jgi:manganese/zinc/iron transport system permease protein